MTCLKDPESAEKEMRLQQAVAAYKKKQKMSQKMSLQHIAKDFNVPWQTLKDWLDGKPPCNKAHKDSMQLTNIEEMELVHWITTLTQHGYAPQYHIVQELSGVWDKWLSGNSKIVIKKSGNGT